MEFLLAVKTKISSERVNSYFGWKRAVSVKNAARYCCRFAKKISKTEFFSTKVCSFRNPCNFDVGLATQPTITDGFLYSEVFGASPFRNSRQSEKTVFGQKQHHYCDETERRGLVPYHDTGFNQASFRYNKSNTRTNIHDNADERSRRFFFKR